MVAVSGVDRDRSGLFAAVADFCPVDRALYPGSYVDLSPSTAFRSVTYVDTDARAARFFADTDLVRAQLAGRTRPGAGQEVRFLPGDYTQPLAVPERSVDLVISLFAGLTWDHARRYLRPGGWLLANTSHGEASLAALNPSLRLVAAVHARRTALTPLVTAMARPTPEADINTPNTRRNAAGCVWRSQSLWLPICGAGGSQRHLKCRVRPEVAPE